MKKILFSLLLILSCSAAFAQEGFIGEVKLFAGNFAPRNWAFCEGQLLPISSNAALFSILGTTYGGDGRSTFALPKMEGISFGQLPYANTASKGGGGKVTFTATNRTQGDVQMYWVDFSGQRKLYATIKPGDAIQQVSGAQQVWHFMQNGELIETILLNTQDNQSYTIRPLAKMKYIICVQGLFPSRN